MQKIKLKKIKIPLAKTDKICYNIIMSDGSAYIDHLHKSKYYIF